MIAFVLFTCHVFSHPASDLIYVIYCDFPWFSIAWILSMVQIDRSWFDHQRLWAFSRFPILHNYTFKSYCYVSQGPMCVEISICIKKITLRSFHMCIDSKYILRNMSVTYMLHNICMWPNAIGNPMCIICAGTIHNLFVVDRCRVAKVSDITKNIPDIRMIRVS